MQKGVRTCGRQLDLVFLMLNAQHMTIYHWWAGVVKGLPEHLWSPPMNIKGGGKIVAKVLGPNKRRAPEVSDSGPIMTILRPANFVCESFVLEFCCLCPRIASVWKLQLLPGICIAIR